VGAIEGARRRMDTPHEQKRQRSDSVGSLSTTGGYASDSQHSPKRRLKEAVLDKLEDSDSDDDLILCIGNHLSTPKAISRRTLDKTAADASSISPALPPKSIGSSELKSREIKICKAEKDSSQVEMKKVASIKTPAAACSPVREIESTVNVVDETQTESTRISDGDQEKSISQSAPECCSEGTRSPSSIDNGHSWNDAYLDDMYDYNSDEDVEDFEKYKAPPAQSKSSEKEKASSADSSEGPNPQSIQAENKSLKALRKNSWSSISERAEAEEYAKTSSLCQTNTSSGTENDVLDRPIYNSSKTANSAHQKEHTINSSFPVQSKSQSDRLSNTTEAGHTSDLASPSPARNFEAKQALHQTSLSHGTQRRTPEQASNSSCPEPPSMANTAGQSVNSPNLVSNHFGDPTAESSSSTSQITTSNQVQMSSSVSHTPSQSSRPPPLRQSSRWSANPERATIQRARTMIRYLNRCYQRWNEECPDDSMVEIDIGPASRGAGAASSYLGGSGPEKGKLLTYMRPSNKAFLDAVMEELRIANNQDATAIVNAAIGDPKSLFTMKELKLAQFVKPGYPGKYSYTGKLRFTPSALAPPVVSSKHEPRRPDIPREQQRSNFSNTSRTSSGECQQCFNMKRRLITLQNETVVMHTELEALENASAREKSILKMELEARETSANREKLLLKMEVQDVKERFKLLVKYYESQQLLNPGSVTIPSWAKAYADTECSKS